MKSIPPPKKAEMNRRMIEIAVALVNEIKRANPQASFIDCLGEADRLLSTWSHDQLSN